MRQRPPLDHQASPRVARSKLSLQGTATATGAAPRRAAWRKGNWTATMTAATGMAIRGASHGCRAHKLLPAAAAGALDGGGSPAGLTAAMGLRPARSALMTPPRA